MVLPVPHHGIMNWVVHWCISIMDVFYMHEYVTAQEEITEYTDIQNHYTTTAFPNVLKNNEKT